MPRLSVIIPARQEPFLGQTIADVLAKRREDTEVIAVLDGAWPVTPIPDHPALQLLHSQTVRGQRASVNDAARLSRATYLMKLDAHCMVDEGFDVKLMAACDGDWTVIPRMYNLHAFDWACQTCGERTYQGPKPDECRLCHGVLHERHMVWQPRLHRRTDFARFDRALHFQYWRQYEKRPEATPDIADVLCSVGACWFQTRQRFLDLGGLDEGHGSWGQVGVEVACKAWLSGGRQVVNKTTWFSHLFRTQAGFSFPYPMDVRAQEAARVYSRRLWLERGWPQAVRPFQWMLDHFAPVPDWENACVAA
ncbi:MAG TPA: glycosyltransferase [Phycisphaerae bacterium]|nr:glycosyltransferase [Phycisphaerae bacterium]